MQLPVVLWNRSPYTHQSSSTHIYKDSCQYRIDYGLYTRSSIPNLGKHFLSASSASAWPPSSRPETWIWPSSAVLNNDWRAVHPLLVWPGAESGTGHDLEPRTRRTLFSMRGWRIPAASSCYTTYFPRQRHPRSTTFFSSPGSSTKHWLSAQQTLQRLFASTHRHVLMVKHAQEQLMCPRKAMSLLIWNTASKLWNNVHCTGCTKSTKWRSCGSSVPTQGLIICQVPMRSPNFFNLLNPFSSIIALKFTHPLIEMSIRSFWGKERPVRKADTGETTL
jgi:hypothetical protein